MGYRFIDDKAAERDSEEEYDQDDNNPLCKFLFSHFNPLPFPQISEYMRGGMEENGVNAVFHQGKSSILPFETSFPLFPFQTRSLAKLPVNTIKRINPECSKIRIIRSQDIEKFFQSLS